MFTFLLAGIAPAYCKTFVMEVTVSTHNEENIEYEPCENLVFVQDEEGEWCMVPLSHPLAEQVKNRWPWNQPELSAYEHIRSEKGFYNE